MVSKHGQKKKKKKIPPQEEQKRHRKRTEVAYRMQDYGKVLTWPVSECQSPSGVEMCQNNKLDGLKGRE